MLDFHLLCRLCRTWTDGGTEATRPEHAHALLRRNLGRVRARLRAMLAETPEILLGRLLELEGLHAATLSATRRLAWAFARRELETGFSMSFARASMPACPLEPDEDLGLDDQAALSTWVLLVMLRGRLSQLERWMARGTTEDHDAVWGRLLSVALPAPLQTPEGKRHHRLRSALRARLPALIQTIQPVLWQVAALEPGRGLRAAFERLLRPRWHPAVPFPRRDFPSLVRNALVVSPEPLLEER